MNPIKKINFLFFVLLLSTSCRPSEKQDTKQDTKQNTAVKKESLKWRVPNQYPKGDLGKEVRYGEELIKNTAQHLGPEQSNPKLRVSGNHLNCQSCHLKAGQQENAMGFVGVSKRYPKYRGRENRVTNLTERVNGCFQRSMNGKTLDKNSREMHAILAYMAWLSEGMGGKVEGRRLPKIPFLSRAADPKVGKQIYAKHCIACHGKEGQGMPKNPNALAKGYTFPPLWGKDSYNNGAGMSRVYKAAQFIHANMPLGNPSLSIEQAYDVSAYINSQPRPQKSELEKDYPDLSKKPVDTPYGPYTDNFSETAHKYGPFDLIIKEKKKQ